MVSEAANRVAEKSGDAWSVGRYKDWPAVAEALLKAGYSEKRAEQIMRSKWTRWAADEANADDVHKATAKDLMKFVKKQTKKDRDELFALYDKEEPDHSEFKYEPSEFKYHEGDLTERGWKATINGRKARITEDDPDEWWLTLEDEHGRTLYNGALSSQKEAEAKAREIANGSVTDRITDKHHEVAGHVADEYAKKYKGEVTSIAPDGKYHYGQIHSQLREALEDEGLEYDEVMLGYLTDVVFDMVDDEIGTPEEKKSSPSAPVKQKKTSSTKKKSRSKTSGWSLLKKELPSSSAARARLKEGGHKEGYKKVLESLVKYWEKRGK